MSRADRRARALAYKALKLAQQPAGKPAPELVQMFFDTADLSAWVAHTADSSRDGYATTSGIASVAGTSTGDILRKVTAGGVTTITRHMTYAECDAQLADAMGASWVKRPFGAYVWMLDTIQMVRGQFPSPLPTPAPTAGWYIDNLTPGLLFWSGVAIRTTIPNGALADATLRGAGSVIYGVTTTAIVQLATGDMSLKADKPTGTTANEVALLDASGNLAKSGRRIGTALADVPITQDVRISWAKVLYVMQSANAAIADGSPAKPFATLAAAHAATDGSGWTILVLPGNYGENVTLSNPNLTVAVLSNVSDGLANFANINVANTTSSIRLFGLTTNTMGHTQAGRLFMRNVTTNVSFTKSGGGYLYAKDCDTQGGSLTGLINITGGGPAVIDGGTVGVLTVNNNSALVSVYGHVSSGPVVHQAGFLALGAGPFYSSAPASNALTSTGGTLVLDGPTFMTTSNTPARISIAVGVVYQIIKAQLDRANSALLGTRTEVFPVMTRGARVTYQTSSATFPANPASGDWLVVTATGTSVGKISEQWLYDDSGWVLMQGTAPVSAAVLDNSIANSANATAVGRYIVPATGLAGAFVGNANRYADWDGTTWTFTPPAANDTVQIISGANSGAIVRFASGAWAQVGSTGGGYLCTATSSVSHTMSGAFVADLCRYNVVDASMSTGGAAAWFNTATFRFQPAAQGKGWWRITASYDVFRGSAIETQMIIRKNGGGVNVVGAFGAIYQQLTTEVYLNGSTDYVDVVTLGGAAVTRGQNAVTAKFQARWISA